MSEIDVPRTYEDGDPLFEADLDNIVDAVETFLNQTGISDDNIQTSGITGSTKLIAGSVTVSKLTSGSDGLQIVGGASSSAALWIQTAKVGDVYNIGLVNATTTNANDSIKIQGASATLSSTNPGYVCIASSTSPGLPLILKITADVTINLTGANWGEGGDGDATDYMLSVYAINNAATLKWGVGSVPNHRYILDADDTATASSASSVEKILVNSALNADSPCIEIGWFKANFDDTGGAAEDLWAVQTGLYDINHGPRPQTWQKFTPTVSLTTNATSTAFWMRQGGQLWAKYQTLFSGTNTEGSYTVTLPFTIDTLRMTATSGGSENLGRFIYFDNTGAGSGRLLGQIMYNTTTSGLAITMNDATTDAHFMEGVSSSGTPVPVAVAASDRFLSYIDGIPIANWY